MMLMFFINAFSQSKKETIYLLFDSNSRDKCKIEVEQTYENKKGIEFVKKYRKEKKRIGFIDFYICDEKFVFNKVKNKKNTCSINSIKKHTIKDIDYMKEKYQKGNDFKHHAFEKIYIAEKISDEKFIKYEVYWSGEWTIE